MPIWVQVVARQQAMAGWLQELKARLRRDILASASRMVRSERDPAAWRPRTTCEWSGLSPSQVGARPVGSRPVGAGGIPPFVGSRLMISRLGMRPCTRPMWARELLWRTH